MTTIPPQLREFKFILVLANDKRPLERWQKPENQYKYDDPRLVNYLRGGGNYGVLCGDGLVVFDFDNVSTEDVGRVVKILGKTFTVKSGSGNGFHLYYKIPGYDVQTTKVLLGNGHIDIRGKGSYVVGPGCVHPTGGKYKIIDNSEVRVIKYEDYMNFIGKRMSKETKTTKKVDIRFRDNVDDDELFAAVSSLPRRIQQLIVKPWNKDEIIFKRYNSRSERDMAIVRALVLNGFVDLVKVVFERFPCGDKYREKGRFGEEYLRNTITKAFGNINITNYDDYVHLYTLFQKIRGAVSRKELGLVIAKQLDEIAREIAEISDENVRDFFIDMLYMSGHRGIRKQVEYYLMHEDSQPHSVLEYLQLEPPPIQYYLEPFIPKNSIVLFAGRPASAKSLLLMYLSLILSSKRKIEGLNISGSPKILYYDLENNKFSVARRLQAMMRGLKMDVNEIEDRFKIVNSFSPAMLSKEVKNAMNYDIIILDSYRRFLRGREEKSHTTNMFYLNFIKPLREAGKTVIIVHHLRKGTTFDEIDEASLMDAIRGSSDILAQIDLAFVLSKIKKIDNNEMSYDVYIYTAKDRDVRAPVPYLFNVEYNMETQVTKLSIQRSAGLSYSDIIANKILEVIKHEEEREGHAVDRTKIIERLVAVLGIPRLAAFNKLRELNKMGYIQIRENKVSVLGIDAFASKFDLDVVPVNKKSAETIDRLLDSNSLAPSHLAANSVDGGKIYSYLPGNPLLEYCKVERDRYDVEQKFGEEAVRKALEDGELFEPRPGKVKKL